MGNVLDYAPPCPVGRRRARWRAAAKVCLPGAAVVAVAGALSSLSMAYFRHREGREILDGPGGDYYQAWVFTVPLVIGSALLAAAWARAVWRADRGDRPVVGTVAAAIVAGLWLFVGFWVFSNAEQAFP